MWLAGFLSVVAWLYVYGMKEAVKQLPSFQPHKQDIIPYVVKISVLRS
jgi:hypothetical protein